MALAYVPPGVNVSETVSPSINPLLSTPAVVALVGPAQGYVQQTDQIALAGTDDVALPNFPQGSASLVSPLVSVSSSNQPGLVYVENTDYVVNYNSNVNEVQTVTLANATGGTFKLSLGEETTTTIQHDATNTTVQSALVALGQIENGDVSVSGGAGGPFTVTFQGQYANTNISQLIADGSALTGSSPTITVHTVTDGGLLATIRRVGNGAIDAGETVSVVYRYVPNAYFTPTLLSDQSSVEAAYGSAFASDGSINSILSFAASIAFENGAGQLILAPLFRRTSDNDPNSQPRQPDQSETADPTTWGQTLYALRDNQDVNVVVPVIGQSFPGLIDSEELTIFEKVQDHIKFMADQQQFIVGVLGEDSTTSTSQAQRDTLRAHAATLQFRYGGQVSEQLIFVSPSSYTRVNPQNSQVFAVGGQYLATAVAGMLAARPVASSLTRAVVAGFAGVTETRSKAEKNNDAAVGLTVVETVGQNVRIRHAVTLDTSSTARREVPVVRAKFLMIESISDTLESQVIGQIVADGNAPATVGSAVAAVLESLKGAGDLVDYANVQARTLTLDPTTVEVRYSYKPAFPLNYINIIFSIDLTTGDVTTTA